MLKKRITYTDYNGRERTEDFWFNYSTAEVAEMTMNGFIDRINKITEASSVEDVNPKEVIDAFKQLILSSYGEKSSDGKRFVKSEERSLAFSQTEAFSALFMEIATDAGKAAEFFNGILPESLKANA